MEKQTYTSPVCKVIEIEVQNVLLNGSVSNVGCNNSAGEHLEGLTNSNRGFTDIWGNEH